MTAASYVVATAGHVDHGKSALVRALTGIEPDRWDEERRRGMTIGLGFAWTRLPGGADVAFVDVPGHERFVTTMLAGVGPVPAVLLVVAADEGWSAQTEEHVAALDALGVRHLLLAVTKSDLADPEPVARDVRRRLAGTSLSPEDAPLRWVAVSATTGDGLGDLRAALDAMLRGLPEPDRSAPVRLWIDRAFTMRGAGTVVTGTLGAGRLESGAALDLAPSGHRVTVRGLQSEERPTPVVEPVRRTAVNLRGVEHDAVRRGDALVEPGRFTVTDEIDVVMAGRPATVVPAALDRPARRREAADAAGDGAGVAELVGARTVVHVGSAAVPARVRALGASVARLQLARRVPLHVGDRLLLRDPGRARGIVAVDVADVVPPPLVRRGAGAVRAQALARRPAGGWAGAAAATAHVAERGIVTATEMRARGYRADPDPDGCVRVGEWWCSTGQLAAWREAAESAVATTPDGEMPVETLRRRLGLPDAAVLVAVLEAAERLAIRGDVVRDRGRAPAPESPGLAALRARLAGNPFDAPDGSELAALGIPPRELSRAVAAGDLLSLGGGVYVGAAAIRTAEQVLSRFAEPFTVAQAREALGVSRRVAVPLLEELDRRRITRRTNQTLRTMRTMPFGLAQTDHPD